MVCRKKRQERADGVSEKGIYALVAKIRTEGQVNRMSDRRFSRLYEPIIELTDREIEKELKETREK